MARPPKYTPERADRIIEAIRLGAAYKHAAAYAGIHVETLDAWRKRYPDFSAKLLVAEGQATAGWMRKIERSADDGDWRAAAWKLERRYPDEYGRRVDITYRVEDIARRIADATGEPYETVLPSVTDLAAERAKRRSA